MAKIFNERKADYRGLQLWLNPVDKTVYATEGAPKYSFGEVNGYALYDFNKHFENQKLAKDSFGQNQYMHDAFVDTEFKALAEDYVSDMKAGGRQRTAALRSSTNSAVDIVNVWETVLGKQDRTYAGKNLAKEIAVPNLLISIDTATKFSGMTQLDEGQLSQLKELSYSRSTFEANKYGLKFVIHEEARLKNVHNVLQDSIQVASNKIEQRQSFDVIAKADASLTAKAAIGVWDTFVSGADRSSNNPLLDLGIAKLLIEGSGVGGRLTRVGMHPLDFAKYMSNTFIRGVASTKPSEVSFESGTRDLPGFPDAGLVLDNAIRQGDVYCVDTEKEPTIALFQGPQRIGSAHDEETGDDKYFIIDYHLAEIIQSETGRQLTGCSTPSDWT
ncbi:MAG: hypothetical protein VW518_06060 [Burkholderiaceae bacterium]|jgi:hypothetical protein